jgi:hypothetical protein
MGYLELPGRGLGAFIDRIDCTNARRGRLQRERDELGKLMKLEALFGPPRYCRSRASARSSREQTQYENKLSNIFKASERFFYRQLIAF